MDSSVPAAQVEGSTAQQGVMSAATAAPTQQSAASAASAVPARASSAAQQQTVAAGNQVPTQAGRAVSAAYPAQQGVVNGGSNVPSQGSQTATSAQGAVDMGTNVPMQQGAASTGSAAPGAASGSTAQATLPKQTNLQTATIQPVQEQLAQSPAVSDLAFFSEHLLSDQRGKLVGKPGSSGLRAHTCVESGHPVRFFKE